MKNYKVAKLKGLNCSQNLFIEVNVVIRTCLETCLGSRNFQMKIERNKFFPCHYKISSPTGIMSYKVYWSILYGHSTIYQILPNIA